MSDDTSVGDTVVTDGERSDRRRNAERYAIGAVSNALALLGALAQRQSLALGEAADIAGVSKSTAYRLLATLESAGLAERLPEGGYRAGANFVRWASQLLGQLDVRSLAEPILRRLRDETGETVNLAVLRDSSLVYVAILQSPSPFRMADEPGAVAQLHCTALGKAVAAHLDPRRLGSMLGEEPYQRYTRETLTTWSDLAAALHAIRTDGYAVDREEVALGVTCVGVVVRSGGDVSGAISVSAPRARMDDERITQVAARLVLAATMIEEQLSPHVARNTRSALTPR